MYINDIHVRPITLLSFWFLYKLLEIFCHSLFFYHSVFWLSVNVCHHPLPTSKCQTTISHFGNKKFGFSFVMATQFGHLMDFQPESNSVKAYLEMFPVYFIANKVGTESEYESSSAPSVQCLMYCWVMWWLYASAKHQIIERNILLYCVLTLSQSSLW